MIKGIVIIIWEDHIYDEESFVRYKNTIVLDLIIDVEPMDIIICVVYGVYTLSPSLSYFVHGDLNLNKVGGTFFSNIW